MLIRSMLVEEKLADTEGQTSGLTLPGCAFALMRAVKIAG
jgi:hypothetical protein